MKRIKEEELKNEEEERGEARGKVARVRMRMRIMRGREQERRERTKKRTHLYEVDITDGLTLTEMQDTSLIHSFGPFL